jgi:MFS family permease
VVDMAEEDKFDIGGLFRSSATGTFVIQIVSVIIMIGSLAAYLIGGFLPTIDPDFMILLLLVGSIVTLMVFLAAMGLFIRFSRKISNAVFPPGLDFVDMNRPRVKPVVTVYAVLVGLMGATGVYIWYLVHKNILGPWAASYNSISLQIFSFALGAFFIALLIQVIIAGVGRSAGKMVLGVIESDDSEFLE